MTLDATEPSTRPSSEAPTAVSSRPASPAPFSSTSAEVTKEKEPIEDEVASPATIKKGHFADGEDDVERGDAVVDEKAAAKAQGPDESKFLTGKALFLCFVGMLLSVFLIALDQTIISPALPVIASRFNALDQIGWIASSYFLTQSSFMLLYGTMLTVFDRKWVFIMAISIFEIGSLFCGVAPSVQFLIFGRAVAGVGAAGIFVACLSIIAETTRLEQRPMFLGSFGAVFAASSIIGPLVGGAFTDRVSWRWCFYINLPVGAITIASIMVIIPPAPAPAVLPAVVKYTEGRWAWLLNIVDKRRPSGPNPKNGEALKGEDRWDVYEKKDSPKPGLFFRVLGLDWYGSIIMIGLVTMLLLPLQWGGNKYPWKDAKIIGLFCGFAGLIPVFVAWEWKLAGPNRILPLQFFRNKTQVGCCLMAFWIFFCMMLAIYFLPVYYQAVRHASSEKSGIDILPMMIGVVVVSGGVGGIITYTGHYWWWIFIGPAIQAVGFGLLYTITENTSNSKIIGFQIVTAVGVGMVMQNMIIAIQANVPREEDVPLATSLVTFTQLIGGVIALSVAQTVFGTTLSDALHKYAPDAPFELVRLSVEAIYTIDPALRPGVIKSYVIGLDNTFLIGVPASGLAIFCALLIKNKNIKGHATGGVAH